MTWLVERDRDPRPAGMRLAELVGRPGILRIPGAHNPLAALLARKAGFEAVYLSGAALTASLALPDLGVLTLSELVFFTRAIVRASGLPLVVDGDTGFGEALNVARTVAELEEAGAAGVQLEDQILPKKCGHLSDKRLAPPDEAARKIAAAARACRNLMVIARTDAAASEGLAAAIDRAKRYLDAGAHVIFPEALTGAEEFRRFATAVKAPILANMTEFGKTPLFTAEEFEGFGVKLLIWPVSSLRASAFAVERLYDELARTGTQKGYLDRMQPRTDLYATIRYHEYEALDDAIAKSVVPGDEPRSGRA